MKTKLFFKHLGKNLLPIVLIWLAMAVCGVVAHYIFGINPIFGLLAFLITMFGYFLVRHSLEQAMRELDDF